MRRDHLSTTVFVMAMLVLTWGSATAADQALLTQAQALFKPLPKVMESPENSVTPEKVALGRLLFFETRVSQDGTVGCVRCHQPFLSATDALPKAIGALGRLNPRNAPTVMNAALQFVAHWRGDRKNVEDQAMQALVGPPSFGNPDYASAMAKLKAIPGYPELFAQAFPNEKDPVTQENWAKAIGAYERGPSPM